MRKVAWGWGLPPQPGAAYPYAPTLSGIQCPARPAYAMLLAAAYIERYSCNQGQIQVLGTAVQLFPLSSTAAAVPGWCGHWGCPGVTPPPPQAWAAPAWGARLGRGQWWRCVGSFFQHLLLISRGQLGERGGQEGSWHWKEEPACCCHCLGQAQLSAELFPRAWDRSRSGAAPRLPLTASAEDTDSSVQGSHALACSGAELALYLPCHQMSRGQGLWCHLCGAVPPTSCACFLPSSPGRLIPGLPSHLVPIPL